jgi:hypothetical protein
MRTAILALLLHCALSAHAQAPPALNYQGHLTNAAGQPVDGAVAITFSLYAQPAGGAALWTETHAAVGVSSGAFSVRLGSVNPLELAFDQPYYLGVSVGMDAEMGARLALGAAAYAVRARSADATPTAAIDTSAIQDASVTPDRLGEFCAPGQVLVRSAEGWQCGLLP